MEESEGTKALVMELVEGPTLAERLESGSLPLEESLSLARQIAEALQEAHEKGIIHRDLKPQNIKAPIEGNVKVLDFGLAKAMDATAEPGSAAELAHSPTLLNSPTLTAVRGTQLGVILGTAAYMAPEQARGATVDKRADIWAFGVVLYEMLAGRSLFAADTVTDTLAGVLKSEIDFAKLPPSTPAAIRRLLRRLLERNPKNRLHDMADARIVIDEVLSGRMEESDAPPESSSDAPTQGRRLTWMLAATTALATVAAVALALVQLRSPIAQSAQALRLEVTPPTSSSPTNRGGYFELSPDGRFLLMVEDGELWVRPLDAVAARRIDGIKDASYPFWSPDSAWIGFFEGGELRKVARGGGRAQKICAAPGGRGASWSPEGRSILYSDWDGDLWLLPLEGERKPVAYVAAPGQAYAQFSPDGRLVAYAIEERGVPRPLFEGVPSPGNSWIFTYAPTEDGQRFLVAAARRGARLRNRRHGAVPGNDDEVA